MKTHKLFEMLHEQPDGYVNEILDNDEVVSSTGYTGLTPSAVLNDEVADNYNDIYNYPYFSDNSNKSINKYPKTKK